LLYFNQFLKILSIAFIAWIPTPVVAIHQPAPVEQVFQVSSRQIDDKTLAIHWAIQPNYHLYRSRIHFHSDKVPIKIAIFPPGIVKQSQLLGKYQIYQRGVTVLLKFAHPLPADLVLIVDYQGCAAAGFCYPPVTKIISSPCHTKQFAQSLGQKVDVAAVKNPMQANLANVENGQSNVARLLASHNLWLVLVAFFGFGLLLSFTPCVLPLIPILSAIVLGQKQLTTLKAFILSATYVMAMALTYAIAGVCAGLAGSYLQAFLQSWWIIVFVSVVFVLLAFSLFGFYELHLPARWQEKLTHITNRQKGGHYLGVALMGCLSTLVISPCVTAPLVGVLAYIGNTGNAVFGGFALFVLGLGSGIPLLIIGTSAGKCLPKSGPWMHWVKIVIGIMMLMMAAWLLWRAIPEDAQIFHWFKPNHNQMSVLENIHMRTIHAIPGLEQALAEAKQANKPVIVDFYANWCLSCKEMEKLVFPTPQVQRLLSQFIVLRADVTANDALTRALEKKFGVIAPPTFLFFVANGRELSEQRIVGQLTRQAFVQRLLTVLSVQSNGS